MARLTITVAWRIASGPIRMSSGLAMWWMWTVCVHLTMCPLEIRSWMPKGICGLSAVSMVGR